MHRIYTSLDQELADLWERFGILQHHSHCIREGSDATISGNDMSVLESGAGGLSRYFR